MGDASRCIINLFHLAKEENLHVVRPLLATGRRSFMVVDQFLTPCHRRSDNGYPSLEIDRRCQSRLRCTNEMMNNTKNSRKNTLASQANAPAKTTNPNAPATIAI